MRFSGSARSSSRYLRTFAASLFVGAVLAACGGGSSSTDGGTSTNTALSGVVQDGSASPVANATVVLGTQTATTGADGAFSFTVADATATDVVLVKKTGYATVAKEAPVASGRTTYITVGLFADQVSTTFNAAQGTSFSTHGASVVIPANAVQTAAGTAYSGTVQVGSSYYGPDTVAGVQAFAAPYEGVSAGVRSPLISAGVIEVKLSDASGNPLQLKTGSTATLTYPANSVNAAGGAIPLWYYDESAKVWVADGQASRQTDGSYVASVSHFTMWNLDYKGDSATLQGCFVNAAGAPQTQAGMFGLRGGGWSRMLPGPLDGNFTLLRVPANIPLELYSVHSPATFTTVAVSALSPGEVRQLPCSTATAVATGVRYTVPLPTTVFTPPVGTFAGNYSGSYSGEEIGTFSVNIASSGAITGSTVSATYSGLVSQVSGNVSGNGSLLLSAGTSGAATFNGTIASNGAVSGTWQYVGGSSAGNTFTGQRN